MEKNKFQHSNQHCFWVWFIDPVKGELYYSTLATTPQEAMKLSKEDPKNVERVYDCYALKNYPVSRGTINS